MGLTHILLPERAEKKTSDSEKQQRFCQLSALSRKRTRTVVNFNFPFLSQFGETTNV
jgi:hypothetical protein